jgi:hypothetical protein
VRSEIVGPEISLDFDDSAHALHTSGRVDQAFTEELVSDDDRIAVVEIAWKLMSGNISHAQPFF